jgi:branched-chain amino acid transport system ATP-binding protein
MTAAIKVEGIVAGYGRTVVLNGVSFEVPAGGSLAVLGRNGVGKTTLLNTLMGFTTRHAGSIQFNSRPIERVVPFQRNRLGIGYVPQEREIFASLTVEENLAICRRSAGWSIPQVYELFPSLKERRRNGGSRLSGGEQQMLAIGRALVGGPRLLLLDEPMGIVRCLVRDSRQRRSNDHSGRAEGGAGAQAREPGDRARPRPHRASRLQRGAARG